MSHSLAGSEDPQAQLDAPSTESEALLARLRRRERELAAIRQVSAALHAQTHVEELEREALRVAIETLEATSGTIYLHNPEKKTLVFRYVIGTTPEITRQLEGMEMPDDTGISGQVFHCGQGRITLKVADDKDHNTQVDAATHFRTENILTAPLRAMDGRTVGVIQVLNRRVDQFDEEDLAILEVIGTQVGSAIENARLHAEARRASVINLIGDISHDVKNLLTPVQTGMQTLEMLMDQAFTDLDYALLHAPDEVRTSVENALIAVRGFYTEASRMICDGSIDAQERVREIADAIKGIIHQPHFELSDFRERAESVARVLRVVAERKGVMIDLSGLQDTGPVELDRKSVYNALYNLINNAIPETPAGGRIMVRSRSIDLDGQPGLEIQVEDTGRGMPPHVRERLFTDNAISTKPGGTGLGTRIVKNVVEMHHGTISVESTPGEGTTFTIRIPQRQPKAASQP